MCGKPRECDEIRPAIDADDVEELKRNPKSKDGKLEVELDESFPASDPPSQTQNKEKRKPPPSTGAPKS
jgi:hypothetical protein